MNPLLFSQLDENLFQGILVVSSTPKSTSSDWLKRIIENSINKSNLEFQPVLENGEQLLQFDIGLQPTADGKNKTIEPIKCHRAMLDNKYYTTQIYLVELDDPVEFPERFNEFIHGIIIYIDNDDENCLKNLDKWTQYIDSMENCAIRIFSCENASNDDQHPISKIDIQNYSIEKGFELIELMPTEKNNDKNINSSVNLGGTPANDEELEDDFLDTQSFERLYKAIQAYVWPNLNYKEKHSKASISSTNSDALLDQLNRLNLVSDSFLQTTSNPQKKSQKIKPKSDDNDDSAATDAQTTENTVEEEKEEEEEENFEELFSKFNEMKQTASKITDDDERKRYAEQVAISFWNTISDDKDEVLLNSSDDDATAAAAADNKEDGSDPNHVYL